MKTQFYSAALLVLLAFSAQRISAGPLDQLKWSVPAMEKVSSINLYKEYFGYLFAALGNGVPSLYIPALDPISLPFEMMINPRQPNPKFPQYKAIKIILGGVTVSNYSKTVATVADHSDEKMSSNLSLYTENLHFSWGDLTAKVLKTDGSTTHYNCSNASAELLQTRFNSTTQLQLVDDRILQVQKLNMTFEVPATVVTLETDNCDGDAQLSEYIASTIHDSIEDTVDNTFPKQLEFLSEEYATILNEILALRNVTDVSNNCQHIVKHQGIRSGDNFVKQSLVKKNKKAIDSGLEIKWF